jgi:MFS family permease
MMHAQAEKQPVEDRANRRRLHPTVIATGWASFFNDVSSEMIYPLLPMFLTSTLGVGVGFVGLLEGIAESTTSLVKLISGWLSDRLRNRKGLVVLGYLLASTARPLISLTTSGWQVLGLRFVDRVGKGLRGAPRDALVADFTDESNRGLAYGYQRAMDHAGAVIGPLIATALLGLLALGYRPVFALAAMPAALCVLTVWLFIKEPKPTAKAETQPPSLSALLSSWRGLDRRLKGLLLAMGVFALGNSSDAFLILRASELGVKIELIPVLWTVLHVSKSLLSVPGGALSDRLGRRRIIIAGWIIYGLVYIGFALAWSQWHAWLLFAVYGLYFALTEGAERAFVADVVRPEQRGTAFGLYNFVLGLAALPASVIFGSVWERLGFQSAFLLGAGLALVASVMLIGSVKENYERTA